MAAPERVLIDTSAYYALVDTSDAFHKSAEETYTDLLERERELWTTSYVALETMALVHRRLGLTPLKAIVDFMERHTQRYWVGPTIHSEAWQELLAHNGSDLNFVDWTTTVTARRLRAHIFTFDQGFAKLGSPTVRLS